MRLTPRKILRFIGGVFVLNIIFNLYFMSTWTNFKFPATSNQLRLRLNSSTIAANKRPLEAEIYWDSSNPDDDRILKQLDFVPEAVRRVRESGRPVGMKTILIFGEVEFSDVLPGNKKLVDDGCKVQACHLTDDFKEMATADAIIFTYNSEFSKPSGQIWIFFALESPRIVSVISGATDSTVNWTATYRHDSTISSPYGKFVPFNDSERPRPQNRNYAQGKTKMVAWFASNCYAFNSRKRYAKLLGQHVQVDVYGACGPLKCPRGEKRCSDILNTDYKFYLSFESANCRDYITEKFFVNGLQHDVVPIVMGAAPEDYRRSAPPHSFIHVDYFESPADLAAYLKKLDQDDDLYNEYFRWKGTGSFINTLFWCRVCSLLHDTDRHSSYYHDVNQWWRGSDDEVCTAGQRSWEFYRKKKEKRVASPGKVSV